MNRLFSTLFLFGWLTIILLRSQTHEPFSTAWGQDTLQLEPKDSILVLTHPFILKNTETIIANGKLVKEYQLEAIPGKVVIHSKPVKTTNYIVTYKYLRPPFPTRFGPPISSLPLLESLTTKSIPLEKFPPSPDPEEEYLPMVTDGSLFRGITISPLGGLSLTGGLRLSLQGYLTEDMVITGSLTDQNSPIQPEGNTQTLDEIDKVYLEVKHPSAKIVAGDIDMILNNGQYLTLSRRLEGLHVDLLGQKTVASGYLGSTKGKFHKIEFMGEDQNQGPYSLSSEIGSRAIIVMAGSERVWVDGKRLERGENNDYTIDYSNAEITFTPSRVIDANSRIYVEFEYSDLIYPRNIASASLTRSFAEDRVVTSIGWVQEKDNVQSNMTYGISQSDRDQLKRAGDDLEKMRMFTAEADSTGNYIQTEEDGITIFVYIPDDEKMEGVTYYRVNFHKIGPEGEYARNITPDGKLFFSYVDPEDRGAYFDLYVPWKHIKSPQTQQVINITTDAYLSDSTQIGIQITGSLHDQNLYSQIDDSDNRGIAGYVDVHHTQGLPLHFGSISFHGTFRQLSNNFSTFQRDRRVEFSREWNLSNQGEIASSGEKILEFELSHRYGKILSSSVSYGTYRDTFQLANRWEEKTWLSTKWIPQLNMELTTSLRKNDGISKIFLIPPRKVRNDSTDSIWSRRRLSTTLFPGKIHLYIHHLGERRTLDFRFNESGGGIQVDGNHIKTKVGITKRVDDEPDIVTKKWKRKSDSYLREITVWGRWRSGLKVNAIVKNQIKSYFQSAEDVNYFLARTTLGYSPRNSFIKTHIDFKLEETMFEQKISIYDSVGVGLGNYRYDPDYDQYFYDPNGDYIQIYIPSGEKVPSSRFISGVKTFFDFRKTNLTYLKNITWKIYGLADFNGSVITQSAILNPSLSMADIHRSRVSFRNEFTYSSLSGRRLQLSSHHRKEVSRLTIQESSKIEVEEYEFQVEEPVAENVTFTTIANTKFHEVLSSISLRERRVEGWLVSPGFRWQTSKQLEIGSDLFFGSDRGHHADSQFNVNLRGLRLHLLWFVRRGGRIESSADYFNVNSKKVLSTTLPPEAADGFQMGSTVKLTISGIMNLSNNISLTTSFSYLNDVLHDDFVNFNGEIRATF